MSTVAPVGEREQVVPGAQGSLAPAALGCACPEPLVCLALKLAPRQKGREVEEGDQPRCGTYSVQGVVQRAGEADVTARRDGRCRPGNGLSREVDGTTGDPHSKIHKWLQDGE
eukprot:scaffold34730_cov112-Isochrysis_galbana.AAC.3